MKKVQTVLSVIIFFCFSGSFSAQILPGYSITALDPASSGYYFLAPEKINGTPPPGLVSTQLILDGQGRIVYYKFFPTSSVSDFKMHGDGRMSYSRATKFYLMDSTFTVVDSVYPKNNVLFDGHDMQILPNGHFLMVGIESATMNLSAYNYFGTNHTTAGSSSAVVRCGVIQEQDANKNVVFEWHAKDHYSFSDVDPLWLSSPSNVDWTHFNAVAYDSDGNFLVSVRHFDEITKIRRSDSTIIWRLGGNANQFTFTNDAQKFVGQHDIRRISNGNITLFDNGRLSPLHSVTAKEYQLDENLLTATLAWNYVENSGTYSRSMGNHQRLSNGNTLVNYGNLNNLYHTFNVVKPNGSKVFQINFTDTLRSYRAFNYLTLPWDLKRPVVSCSLNNGQVVLDAGPGHSSYKWSNGATTQTITVSSNGTYSVFVPKGQGGFIASIPFTVDLANPCLITSLQEKYAEKIVVYPNPVKDMIIIQNPSGQPLLIELYNSLGEKVYSNNGVNLIDSQINISNFDHGIYFLKINDLFKKVIKE